VSERRHLGSTYRLQLNGLGFAGATALVPFMHGLGVETCYVSPITRARAGSSHGYDVVDPTVLDPSLGTPEAFEELLARLAAHSMGLLVDIVPNHMAASVENPFFADVLSRGQGSEFAAYFDIAWDEQGGKILLPVLGKPLVDALSAGEIRLEASDQSEPMIGYFETRFPVASGSVGADVAETLANQHYRLADWRVANREVNYRRFFDINELIGVRQEDTRVFAETHRLVAELAADPRIVGFRVDHVDGLRDPAAYLSMLRRLTGRNPPAPVILVEKIVAGSETLPDWPIEGTTGYEFADLVVGLFIDTAGAAAFANAAGAATGDHRSFAERAVEARRRVLDSLFPHQLDQVAAAFVRALAGSDEADVEPADARLAIRELTTYLEVYRTYRCVGAAIRGEDLERLREAAFRARAGLSDGVAGVLDRVVTVVSGDLGAGDVAWQATAAWQQLSGPVAAKGVEDTAMYDSGHLLAAADVGADPDRPAASNERFHAAMVARRRDAPSAMSSTSTHDSKRSHDVRCRLAVLSELAADWEATVEALDRHVLGSSGSSPPDVADRRYLYETVVGAWPVSGEIGDDFVVRIRAYVVKAAREAKRHSNWLDPDVAYEAVLGELAQRIIQGEPVEARRLIEAVVSRVECAGATNSLASIVLKATPPGVPDIYQGDDGWFFALVDPDNRLPLDASAHAKLLSQLPPTADAADHSAAVAVLLEEWRNGAVKQLVVRNSLEARRREAKLFALGSYERLEVVGEHRDHVLAFARVYEGRTAITLVPRGVYSLSGPARFPVGADTWANTAVVLPSAAGPSLTDVLTGRAVSPASGRIALAEAFATLPVALLLA
jgi:(1->4)-alpha-D-glucan 1-alpha-D-glucosylmutase